jgi:hypothetical protein
LHEREREKREREREREGWVKRAGLGFMRKRHMSENGKEK